MTHSGNTLSLYTNIVFVLMIALSIIYYFAIERPGLIDDYSEWHAQIASKLANGLLGEQSSVHRLASNGLLSEIRSHDGAYVRVAAGGVGYFVICFLAAILAWPSRSTVVKIVFATGAFSLALALHFAHTILLFNIDIWWRDYFGFWSTVGSPMLVVLMATLYFLLWIKASGKHPMENKES